MPFNPYDILGVAQGADKQHIIKAFRKQSLVFHPDRETGDAKKFQELNRAYEILTNSEAFSKWQASDDAEDLHIDDEQHQLPPGCSPRPSASYRKNFQTLITIFKRSPLHEASQEKKEKAFQGLSELSKEWLKEDYYKDVIKLPNGERTYADIFELVSYKTICADMPKPIKTSFFQEKLSQKKVFSILLTFLQGTYYGDNMYLVKMLIK